MSSWYIPITDKGFADFDFVILEGSTVHSGYVTRADRECVLHSAPMGFKLEEKEDKYVIL